jgi:ribosomal protein S18 acetylase RimI-like enzyme
LSLIIRKFIIDKDEVIWVDINNQARKEFEDYTPDNVEFFRKEEKSPWFSLDGMFIVELDGRPVGTVDAHIDKNRTEKKGFLVGPAVLPEFRRKGIGTALARKTFESLKQRSMKSVQATITNKNKVGQLFLEKFGFNQVRVFSLMRRSLSDIPNRIGESESAELIAIGKTEDEIKLCNRLHNEVFKEHYNFRTQTLEETRYFICNLDEFGALTYGYFALIDKKPVGYLTYGINTEDNKYHNKKCGFLYALGVLKEFRREGIATKLILESMNLLKSNGMEEVELVVDETNPTEAIKLYEKLGFKVVENRFFYLKKLI